MASNGEWGDWYRDAADEEYSDAVAPGSDLGEYRLTLSEYVDCRFIKADGGAEDSRVGFTRNVL